MYIEFTHHARVRYKERFPDRIENSDVVKSLRMAIAKSVETKHYLNDSNFMIRLYETHGYERQYEFRILDEVVFVIADKKLVTVYNANNTKWELHRSKRFRQKIRSKILDINVKPR